MTKKGFSIKQNIIAMSAVQGMNYLIPLLIFPILVRGLESKAYGQFAYIQAVIAFFILMVEFGFGWSATKKISQNRNNKKNLSKIVIDTMFAELIIALIGLIIIIVLSFLISDIKDNINLILLAYIQILGIILFPDWLFQGLELMKHSSIIQIISKLTLIPFLILLIKKPDDLTMAITIMAMAQVLSGIMGISYIIKYKIINLNAINIHDSIIMLKEGFPYFLSKINLGIFTLSIPIVIGNILGYTSVGYYNIADKIRAAAMAGLNPISVAIFPRMADLYVNNLIAAKDLLKKSFYAISILTIILGIFIYFLADIIIKIIAGANFEISIEVLKCFSIFPLIVGLSNILAIQVFMAKSKNDVLNMIRGISNILGFLILYPALKINGVVGAAQSLVCIEIICFFVMYFYAKNKELI
jgi:PST family polysaccharide transporter